ncbi:MAG: TMEM175 family protein [Prochlorococcus sp.]
MRQEQVLITPIQQRAFDRLINFTDAVVAIAITLQLLPLADIEGPKADQSVWSVVSDNSTQIFAFALSFIVVMILWLKHNQVFNIMRTYDTTILWLNTAWLMGIVFLPWPAAMYGSAPRSDLIPGIGGVGLLYWWTMAWISGIGWLIARHAWKTPQLLEEAANKQHKESWELGRIRGAAFFLYFFVMGIASEFAPGFAEYLALGLIPLSMAIKRKKR